MLTQIFLFTFSILYGVRIIEITQNTVAPANRHLSINAIGVSCLSDFYRPSSLFLETSVQ